MIRLQLPAVCSTRFDAARGGCEFGWQGTTPVSVAIWNYNKSLFLSSSGVRDVEIVLNGSVAWFVVLLLLVCFFVGFRMRV